MDDSEKIQLLMDKIPGDISEETYAHVITMSDKSLKELETVTKAVIETVMEGGIKEDSIDRAKTYIIEEFRNLKLPQEFNIVGEEIAFQQ